METADKPASQLPASSPTLLLWSRQSSHDHHQSRSQNTQPLSVPHLTQLITKLKYCQYTGLPGWAGTRKGKPIWISLKQETVSGSGISWAICRSAPRSRQITTPATHRSVFYRPHALPATQPTVSKHWKQKKYCQYISIKSILVKTIIKNNWAAYKVARIN